MTWLDTEAYFEFHRTKKWSKNLGINRLNSVHRRIYLNLHECHHLHMGCNDLTPSFLYNNPVCMKNKTPFHIHPGRCAWYIYHNILFQSVTDEFLDDTWSILIDLWNFHTNRWDRVYKSFVPAHLGNILQNEDENRHALKKDFILKVWTNFSKILSYFFIIHKHHALNLWRPGCDAHQKTFIVTYYQISRISFDYKRVH